MPHKDPDKQREYCRKWYAENLDKAREASRKWRAANKDKAKEYKRKWYAANKEKSNEADRNWYAANKEKAKEVKRKWRAADPNRTKSHNAVKRALKSGKLTKKPCIHCGDPKSQAHHPDYNFPLEVVWLCKKHHARLHVAIDRLKKEIEDDRATI